ncbi:siderophore biosynthesis [Fusarium heterosporum]|uniref:Siderophore biosynthesis n=1 Tax=Fusarium heterosporum TaxID=42747 RepID=A0A8H5U0C6_FUSHE|nr:siderophore biosynthesis [Fusarium heterosporum]
MYKPTLPYTIPLFMLAKQALGFGCSAPSYTTCEDRIAHWFDPDDGMICDPLDCGGGRAPPKHGPGCAGYTGTETRGTSYLSCWRPRTTLVAAPAESTTVVVVVTAEPSTTVEVVTKVRTLGVNESTVGDETPTETAEAKESKSESPSIGEKLTNTSMSKTGPTTAAPVLPSQTQSTKAEASTPSVVPNGARGLKGSLVAIAGVAVGAVVFL